MIIRTQKNKNYTTISNVGLNDDRLSLQARGLYAFLLSKPDGWQITVNGLYAQLMEGRDSVRKILKELETNGYIVHIYGKKNGKFASSMDLTETPLLNSSTGNQERETSTAMPTQVSTNINTKSNKDTTYLKVPDEIKELVEDFKDSRKILKKPLTTKALSILLTKLERLAPNDFAAQRALLESSIEFGWLSVYPVQKNDKKPNQSNLRSI